MRSLFSSFRERLMHDIIVLAGAITIGAASFAILLKKFGTDCIP